MSTFAEYMAEYTPDRREIRVILDGSLRSDLAQAEARLEAATEDDDAQQARQVVDALKAEAIEKTHVLVFESLGRKRWLKLVDEHPPTEESRERFGGGYDYDPDTFAAAAIAATCVDPKMNEAEAQWLLDQLPVNIGEAIFATAVAANLIGGGGNGHPKRDV